MSRCNCGKPVCKCPSIDDACIRECCERFICCLRNGGDLCLCIQEFFNCVSEVMPPPADEEQEGPPVCPPPNSFIIQPGEFCALLNKTTLKVPSELVFQSREFAIHVAGAADIQRADLVVTVEGGDDSVLQTTFTVIPVTSATAPPPEPGSKGEFTITLQFTKPGIEKQTVELRYQPNLNVTPGLVAKLDALRAAISGTDIEAFVTGFNLFDALGPINPKSMLENFAILLGPTIPDFCLVPVPFVRRPVNGKPSLFRVILECGARAVACVLGTLAAATGVGIAAALVNCGLQGTACGDLIVGYRDP